jgi:phosphoglycerate kinase
MSPVLPALEDLIQQKVAFLNDCVGAEVEKQCREPAQKITMLENLRFHLAEEGKGVINDEKVKANKEDISAFRQSLSQLGDLYVNDAFGTSHRAHSSMVGVNVETRAAGFLLKKELDYFSKVLEQPDKPLTVIMGGAKVKDKIQLIMNMLDIVDEMVIGGGMAFTFNKVLDKASIGASLYDEEGAAIVPDIMKKAQEKGVKIHLPVDFICGDKFEADAAIATRSLSEGVQDGWMGMDIGPKSTENFLEVVGRSKTIFWNGPQGVFEMEKFSQGSLGVLDGVIKATQRGATSVIGGGDTVNLLKKVAGSAEQMSHVSTGGGASLELVEGKQLPGIVALSDKA